ncbi:mCG147031 [Mus musculus]|nr:mCG147031 [Mus musculus]
MVCLRKFLKLASCLSREVYLKSLLSHKELFSSGEQLLLQKLFRGNIFLILKVLVYFRRLCRK